MRSARRKKLIHSITPNPDLSQNIPRPPRTPPDPVFVRPSLECLRSRGVVYIVWLHIMAVSENDPCNITLGLGRCPHTGECYELFRECDGLFDCEDGYDETACECGAQPWVRRFLRVRVRS